MNARGLNMGAALALALAPSIGRAQPPAPAGKAPQASSCFYVNELRSNRALNDHSVILRVNVSDFYRLDFADTCHTLTYPDPKLILSTLGGMDVVCHALDLDVKVAENGPGEIAEPCIPSALHRMTPAEVAAVPKKSLPP